MLKKNFIMLKRAVLLARERARESKLKEKSEAPQTPNTKASLTKEEIAKMTAAESAKYFGDAMIANLNNPDNHGKPR